MHSVVADLAFTVRQLLQRRGYAAMAVLALALGTGGATAIYSLVDAVLVQPLPFPAADRLISVCETHASVEAFCVVSPPNAADWETRSHTIAAIGQGRSWPFTMRADGAPQSVNGGLATPSLFSTLGVTPHLGRTFGPHEIGEAAHVALLTHPFWVSRFGSDGSIIGRTIELDGARYEIVGVLPQTAAVPTLETVQVWVPLPFDRRDETRRRWRGFVTIARLHDRATIDEAAAELRAIQQQLAQEYPVTNANWSARARPLLETVAGPVRPVLLALLGAVMVLLLIACANVTSLLLARGATRERELAIRAALGASRGSLARLLALESVLLALAGGAAGAIAASWMANALLRLMPGGLPRVEAVSLDARVLAAALLVTIGAGLIAGVIPALRAARFDVVDALKAGVQPAAWRSSVSLRRALLVFEVALAVLLATGAGLLGRGFYNFLQWQPGFEPRGLVLFWTFASSSSYKTAADVTALFERIESSVAATAGVTGAGMTSNGPLFGGSEPGEFVLPGLATTEPVTANWFDMSPSFFATTGIRLTAGRAFSPDDRAGAPLVAMVNEAFAARYLRGRDPIGQRLLMQKREMEIVGVVADVPPITPGARTPPEVYWPYAQSPRWASYFVLRTSLPPETLRRTLETRLQEIDPNMAISNFATMTERIDRQLARPRFQLLLVGAFAVVALTLTMIGVHGLMTTVVAGRRRELGVRVALGATRAGVAGLVLRQVFAIAIGGIALGLAMAFAAARLAGTFLRGVDPADPGPYIIVAVVVAIVAAAAALVPARQAARADPLTSLRAE